jgi:hypothetical protein
MQMFLKETNTQTIKEFFYKFLIAQKGCFSFIFKRMQGFSLNLLISKNVKNSY